MKLGEKYLLNCVLAKEKNHNCREFTRAMYMLGNFMDELGHSEFSDDLGTINEIMVSVSANIYTAWEQLCEKHEVLNNINISTEQDKQ